MTMKKMNTALLIPVCLLILACDSLPCDMKAIEEKYSLALEVLSDTAKLPRSFDHGNLNLVSSGDWTSGFFPGCLWLLHELTGKDKWRMEAEKWCRTLEPEKYNTGTHDLGFMMFCSYGRGYRLYRREEYRDVLLTSANSLASRFNDTVGCLRSWDHGAWVYPVIIDNMMNLELLLWASKNGGSERLREIAISHADRTLANHYREDHSAWHVLDYDPGTGEVLFKKTHQGYSDDSDWARGQAWGFYGYTMMYRETGLERYLEQAEAIAGFMETRTAQTDDGIPYWDYDAPDIPDAPRDASAAAITCSALLDLYLLTGKSNPEYLNRAETILKSLCSPEYFSRSWEENGPFLIKHSVGNKPGGSEIDAGIVYADYYFLESLLRYKSIRN
jgi:unsaturated chondroitin disaccharide hydrolase